MDLKELVRDIPDFPREGILFKDITPLLRDRRAFAETIERLASLYDKDDIDFVAGIDARGFIISAPLALKLDAGFLPIRKPGKLPANVIERSYELEYGQGTLELHMDAVQPGDRVLIVDDLLATGGTAQASIELVEALGGTVAGLAFVIELEFLKGKDRLKGYDVKTLIHF